MTQSFACPLCGKDDMVRKVSAIVAEETTTNSHTGYAFGSGGNGPSAIHIHTSGLSQTTLSELLDFPDQKYPSLEVLQTIGLTLFIAGLVLALFGGLAMRSTFLGILFVPLAILGGMMIGIVSFIQHQKMKFDRPQQEKAFARWDALYYCGRNDIVFLPGSLTMYAPAEEIDTLIFAP